MVVGTGCYATLSVVGYWQERAMNRTTTNYGFQLSVVSGQ